MALDGIVIRAAIADTQRGIVAPLIREILWSETGKAASITQRIPSGRGEGSILTRISVSAPYWVTWGTDPDDPTSATARRDYVNTNSNEGETPYDIYLGAGERVRYSPA